MFCYYNSTIQLNFSSNSSSTNQPTQSNHGFDGCWWFGAVVALLSCCPSMVGRSINFIDWWANNYRALNLHWRVSLFILRLRSFIHLASLSALLVEWATAGSLNFDFICEWNQTQHELEKPNNTLRHGLGQPWVELSISLREHKVRDYLIMGWKQCSPLWRSMKSSTQLLPPIQLVVMVEWIEFHFTPINSFLFSFIDEMASWAGPFNQWKEKRSRAAAKRRAHANQSINFFNHKP